MAVLAYHQKRKRDRKEKRGKVLNLRGKSPSQWGKKDRPREKRSGQLSRLNELYPGKIKSFPEGKKREE